MKIVKDELVNQQRSIIVMEQQLKEYSEVISDQRKQIDSIKLTIIAKQWVKNNKNICAFILSSVLQVVASIICGMYGLEQLKYFYQER